MLAIKPLRSLIVLSAFLFVISIAIGYQGSDSGHSVTTDGYEINISTSAFYLPVQFASAAPIEIFVDSNHTQIYSVTIIEIGSNSQVVTIYSETYPDMESVQIFAHLRDGLTARSLIIVVNGDQLSTVPISFDETSGWIISESLFLASIAILPVGIYLSPLNSRKIRFVSIPLFLALATFLGQRYDDYFLITAGARLAEGINPFIPSTYLPPSLKWEYPPLYLVWSALISVSVNISSKGELFYQTIHIYPSVLSGFAYTAWRAISPQLLPELYVLDKIPMIFSVLFLDRKFSARLKGYDQRLWLINPAVILVGVIWGQIDALAVLFMVMGIFYWSDHKELQASLLFSIGGGVKVFPFLALPYLLLTARNKTSVVLGTILGIIPDAVLYLIPGSPLISLATLLEGRSIPTYNGVFSTNGFSWQVILSQLHVTSFPSLFLYVFLPFYIIFLLMYGKHLDIVGFLTIVLIVFFLTYNFLNPQYMLWLIPLLIISSRKLFSVMVSAMCSLYTLLTYSVTYFLNPLLIYNYISGQLGQAEQLRTSISGSPLVISSFALAATVILLLMLFVIGRSILFQRKSPTIS
ncbi:hypothetical protein ApAK_05265 [Thermoplasmatales archaeon AK]|nr:hypothetical protein [Thermoplasmatales archaeon AK]